MNKLDKFLFFALSPLCVLTGVTILTCTYLGYITLYGSELFITIVLTICCGVTTWSGYEVHKLLAKMAAVKANTKYPCPHARSSWKTCPHCLGINK